VVYGIKQIFNFLFSEADFWFRLFSLLRVYFSPAWRFFTLLYRLKLISQKQE